MSRITPLHASKILSRSLQNVLYQAYAIVVESIILKNISRLIV